MTDIFKKHDQIVRISLEKYRNRQYVNIREYYQDENGEFKPTRRGVTLPPDALEEAINGLRKLRKKFN